MKNYVTTNDNYIIRCRDCRHYEWTENRIPEEQTWVCRHWNEETGKDDFCSYGERREQAHDKNKKVKIVANGNCMICGKPLNSNHLFLCKDCVESDRECRKEQT